MTLDPEARRLLELTRQAQTPSARDKARVDQLLGSALLLGSSTANAASAHAAAKLGWSATAFKWTGIALLAVAGGAGYIAWRASRATPAHVPAPVSIAAQTAAPAEPTKNIDAQRVAPALPEPPAAASSQARGEELTLSAARSRSAQRSSSPPRASPGTLPAELDLLHDAQSQWRAGNAAGALSLLTAHRRRFPHSQLAPERDALTVLSLCRTNRTAEARVVARRFLETSQRSPLKTSVEESCAAQP
jgi:hypothetical protein